MLVKSGGSGSHTTDFCGTGSQPDSSQVESVFLTRFEHEGNDFLDQFTMGDKSWFHYCMPKSKERSKIWKLAEENVLWKYKEQPSADNGLGTIFWDRKRVPAEYRLSGSTVTAETYFDTLMNMRKTLKKKDMENCHAKLS